MQQNEINGVVCIDIQEQFSLLLDLIRKLWDGCESESATRALEAVFHKGLDDGRLWIDEYSTIEIAMVLNGDNRICLPLEERRNLSCKGDPMAYQHDALYIFDSHINDGLYDIHECITGAGWSFSKNAADICSAIMNSYKGLFFTPKDESHDTQTNIIKAFKGVEAASAGSLPTPERLTRRFVQYSKDEQGQSYCYSLLSAVYSHALFCAKLKNTQTLINDLLPTYKKRSEPLDFDNGKEIMAIAINNPFVSLINRINPFCFSSTEEYCSEVQNRLSLSQDQPTECDIAEEVLFQVLNPDEDDLAKDKENQERLRSILESEWHRLPLIR